MNITEKTAKELTEAINNLTIQLSKFNNVHGNGLKFESGDKTAMMILTTALNTSK
jgi:hypothetical protein